MAFLDRLYTAKRKVEKRIAVLGGESDTVSRLKFCSMLKFIHNSAAPHYHCSRNTEWVSNIPS